MDYKTRKNKIALELFKTDKCYVCKRNFTQRRACVFHHKGYIDQDVRHSDYDNPHEYLTDLIPMMRVDKKRFECLCNKCHQSITRIQRWSPERRQRLIEVANYEMF